MTLSHQPRGSAVAVAPPAFPSVLAPETKIVYPETDGEPLAEGTAQYDALTETVNKLKGRYRTRADVAVIGNMLLYYEEGNNRASVAPDVFVVFGVENRPRPSYLLWMEGKAPDFVLEVASESTWREDAGRKREVYAQMGVAEYWRFDPTPDSRLMQPPLIGERWLAGAYVPIQVHGDPEWQGYSDVLGLEFRADGGQLQLFDPATQTVLLDYLEQDAQVQAAEARAQAAEMHAKALEAELRRLQG